MSSTYVTNLNTLSLSEFTDLTERMFLDHMEMVQPQARRLFILDPIGLNNGDSKSYAETDGETFASLKAEDSPAAKAKAGVGYVKTVTARRFAKEINISWEMRNLNKYQDVMNKLTDLRNFLPNREELDLTHRLSFATSTSYTDMDGQTVNVAMGDTYALAYSAHTLAGSSTTCRNRVSGDPLFSQGALESALDLTVTDLLTNLGERRVMNFNTIFSTDDTATVAEIKRVLKSQSDTTQNNSGVINPYMGAMEHVILPYLATTATGARDSTKRKWWGICAAGQWQAYFGVLEPYHLVPPEIETPSTDGFIYGVRGMYLVGVPSWKGLVMSCPTSV